MINCLMTSGQPLTDEIREVLFKTAQAMVKSGSKKRSFTRKTFEGQVTTKNEYLSIGNITGMHFEAIVEWGRTRSRVSFLVRSLDLDGAPAAWTTVRAALNRDGLN